MQDALFQAAVQAGLGPTREPDGLLPGSDVRPADLLIPHWCSGRDAALDFTVVNPLQAALVQGPSKEGGSAVDHVHRGKCRKYEERYDAEGITLLPMDVDPAALDTINRLGRQLARNIGREDQKVVRHLRQRLAVLMVGV